MNKNLIIVHFANCDSELQKAYNLLDTNEVGKIRTLARRAAGFAIDGLLEYKARENYGDSFLSHLSAMENDQEVDEEVREAAHHLTKRVSIEDLDANSSINYAINIIEYCKNMITLIR